MASEPEKAKRAENDRPASNELEAAEIRIVAIDRSGQSTTIASPPRDNTGLAAERHMRQVFQLPPEHGSEDLSNTPRLEVVMAE